LKSTLIISLLLLIGLSSCQPAYVIQDFEDNSSDIQGDMKDAQMASIIDPYREALAEEMNVILCSNRFDMTKDRPESALGNFFSDACLKVARDSSELPIDAAMFSTGGLRSSLTAGPVSVGDIYSLMPFDNELVVIEMPFPQIMAMIEYIAQTGGEPIADMRIELNDSLISSVLIGGKELVERNYFILTTDYLAEGGDDMDFFTEDHRTSIKTLGIKVRDALLIRCEELNLNDEEINYATDGRIKKR
jgi:2',3'-cyclic-nucleotide 2'-phosphodiesterase (5'-nucleotidase family)